MAEMGMMNCVREVRCFQAKCIVRRVGGTLDFCKISEKIAGIQVDNGHGRKHLQLTAALRISERSGQSGLSCVADIGNIVSVCALQ